MPVPAKMLTAFQEGCNTVCKSVEWIGYLEFVYVVKWTSLRDSCIIPVIEGRICAKKSKDCKMTNEKDLPLVRNTTPLVSYMPGTPKP